MYKTIQIQNERCNTSINRFSIHPYHKAAILAIALFLACLCSVDAEESVLQSMEREFQTIVKSVQPSVVEVVATCTVTPQKISGRRGTLLSEMRRLDSLTRTLGPALSLMPLDTS